MLNEPGFGGTDYGDGRDHELNSSLIEEKSRGTVAVDTHGCKLNQADTEMIYSQFVQAGYRLVDANDGPDVYVLNTCTVTHIADSKARKALRAARMRNPNTKIVVTGCYAQRDAISLRRLENVDLVIGNTGKDNLVETVLDSVARQVLPSPSVDQYSGILVRRTRTMVKIQEGCNQICAYCIVPRVRGRERSISPAVILRQIRGRVAKGYKEVVLTGTQLGSYGFDLLNVDLSDLVSMLLKESRVQRLRISSLQPQEITDKLLRLWEDPRLCPHFHMPLQSGNDEVLRLMRRRYTKDMYKNAVEEIHRRLPHARVTADVIVGFPGEGIDQFEETLKFCEDISISGMHVFPYSGRPGTSAIYMRPVVRQFEKGIRKRRMIRVANKKASEYRRRSLGTTRMVLWEKADHLDPGIYWGLTDTYVKVRAYSSRSLVNRICPARLTLEYGEAVHCEVEGSDTSL